MSAPGVPSVVGFDGLNVIDGLTVMMSWAVAVASCIQETTLPRSLLHCDVGFISFFCDLLHADSFLTVCGCCSEHSTFGLSQLFWIKSRT